MSGFEDGNSPEVDALIKAITRADGSILPFPDAMGSRRCRVPGCTGMNDHVHKEWSNRLGRWVEVQEPDE